MALGTYSELQSAVGSWLARPGDPTLSPFIPDFVRLAEARFGRDLRVRGMEQRATAEVDAAYLALPERFLEMRNFQLNTDPVTRLELMSPEQIDSLRVGSRSGRPRWYCVLGTEIQLAPAPDGLYIAEMTYWQQLAPLSLAAPSNWLLANAPDVYLYAALIEATAFIGNDERLPLWTAAYDRAVMAFQASDSRGSWSGSVPQVRTDAGRG
jgi:hypothetical protein